MRGYVTRQQVLDGIQTARHIEGNKFADAAAKPRIPSARLGLQTAPHSAPEFRQRIGCLCT
eukprot:500560-Pyramimonas_sp.AAC.1